MSNYDGWKRLRGMALLPDKVPQIALAAGTQGLLLVPTPLTNETKATVAHLGGDCHDVILVDKKVDGLVSAKDRGQLVELGTATVVARHKLPGVYHRFMR